MRKMDLFPIFWHFGQNQAQLNKKSPHQSWHLYWCEVTPKVWGKSNYLIFGVVHPLYFLPKIEFWLRGVKFFASNHYLLLAWGYSETLSQIKVGWIFAWFGVSPPQFFLPKIKFWVRVIIFFASNHNLLLVWGYPENLSQIRVGWIFAWFGVVPPFFA